MAHYRIPSQQAGHSIPANTHPHPAPLQYHEQSPHEADEYQQGIHREGISYYPQSEMQYPAPRYVDAQADAPTYNVVQYPPPTPPHPYSHMRRDVGIAEAGPLAAQAHPFVPEAQGNHNELYGDGANVPVANPPEAFPGAWPHRDPAPHAEMPPGNDLRVLAGRLLNNPDTLVNMLWIEPVSGGRFEVRITLELAALF